MVEHLLHTEIVTSSNLVISTKYYSEIAQLVEQVTVNHRVVGSSPSCGANVLNKKILDIRGFFYFVLENRLPNKTSKLCIRLQRIA